MNEPAREGEGSPTVHAQWTDLTFHRAPDVFLPMVSARAWKTLCGILVGVWSECRHVVKPNRQVMEDSGLKRSAVVAGLRELEGVRIITCIDDPDGRERRIIQLNWTLKLKWEKGERFAGRIVEPADNPPSEIRTPPVRNSEPPPLNELGAPVRESEPPRSAIRTGGARISEPPPVRNSEPSSYVRDSKERGEKKTERPAASSRPEKGATTPPAESGTPVQNTSPGFQLRGAPRKSRPAPSPMSVAQIATDPVLARSCLLTRDQVERIELAIARQGKQASRDLLETLARHNAAEKLLGPLPEINRGGLVGQLARSLGRPPAVEPSAKIDPDGRREEPHP